MNRIIELRRAHAAGRSALALVAAFVLVTSVATSASAHWSPSGSASGSGSATTATLAAPVDVVVPATAVGAVPVNWSDSNDDVEPHGYYVTRTSVADSSDVDAACSTGPTAVTTALSCSDPAPAGTYRYTVTAVHNSWTATSSASRAVSVTAPTPLGTAASYSVLAVTSVVNTGTTTIAGDLGVSPGTSVTGFGPGMVGGDIHPGDAHAADAQTALVAALDELAGRTPHEQLVGDLGGRTFGPGVFHSAAALAITGTVTLDAQDDPDAIFIFQTDAAFNTAAASAVVLAGGAKPSNVFWVVTGAAGTGADSFLSGSILARGAITLGASTELIGRALSRGTVTLAGNTIRFTGALPPAIAIDGGPTALTGDTTPTISGTSNAPASSAVTVTIAGQTLQTQVGVDGTWTVTAELLTAGTRPVTAGVRDAAGNGGAASQSLTVEVSPPGIALGTAGTYSVLAQTGVVNTDATSLSGDLGVSPSTAVTGFPPGTLAGAMHLGDPSAAQAQVDLLAAIVDGSGRALHTEIIGDLGGRTFHVGVHHSTAALSITGTLTLDAQGDPDAVFIFQTDAAFNTAAASTVVLEGGAQPSNVFWVVTGAAGTGANSFLAGSILARGAITLGASTALNGQALSRGTVTLAANALTGTPPAPVAPDAPPATAPRVEPDVEPSEEPGATSDPTPSADPQPSGDPTPPGPEATAEPVPSDDPDPTSTAAPPVEPDPTPAPEPILPM
jgi:hypothetical protein